MKIFWPHRSKANGFSIKNLAFKYRLKNSSECPSEILNQPIDNRNVISMKEEGKKFSNADLSIKRIHWANRDFIEYKETA